MGEFDWTVQPEAEQVAAELLDEAVARSPRLASLAGRLRRDTSTRLIDWLDHLGGPVPAERLRAAGFVRGYRTRPDLWRHPGAQLPAVVPGERRIVALRVDDAAGFAAAQGATAGGRYGVSGSPLSGFRSATASGADEAVTVAGVERRSWGRGVEPQVLSDRETLGAVEAWRLWAERPRGLDGAEGVEQALAVAEQMVAAAGPDLAGSYVLEIERRYWQRRNTAAVLQHARQDRLGLGWGNNDHHTFRSSRTAFGPLVRLFVTLGFTPRERFYAGAEAGWGAQVLEHPGTGGVVFADVDLDAGRGGRGLRRGPLPDAGRLGTVGLWCALHGESVLAAGMHHLEGQFDFDRLRSDLAGLGVGHMQPFSDLPHLRQAFTEAERWPVAAERLAKLVAAGHLDSRAAAELAARGAAGSHLENLARRGGFKGFNQRNVSLTMRATDPRRC